MSTHPDPTPDTTRAADDEHPAAGPPDDAEDFSPQLADLATPPADDDPAEDSPAP
ncbi:hypothetical protein [Solicola sp. PLA-1-18]|uniref:hypothetical protein n=1 Tax=Solicola sp. PLA-1-18 TaxID=3380532 RepID=UPI003B7C2EE9